jgi:transposase
MFKIRTVKTSSGSTAVQVVEYHQSNRKIISHIGSAQNVEGLLMLRQKAIDWIADNNQQLSLFDYLPLQVKKHSEDRLENSREQELFKRTINWSNYHSFSVRYRILYDALWNIVNLFGFNQIDGSKLLNAKLLNDLVIARIVSPGSKLHSLKFLEKAFNIQYSYRSLSRALPDFINFKDDVETKVIEIAKDHFNFNFNLVFYDLTTLYFESFETDELRRIGFSKDNKASQPQIMIGLLVNESGFPVSYQLFPGNKFEGHTLMPSILQLRKKYKIKQMTIVADSAMLSDDNIKFLRTEKLNYIVAARTANLPLPTITEISKQLNNQDKATIRIATAGKEKESEGSDGSEVGTVSKEKKQKNGDQGKKKEDKGNKGDLICSFSKKRYDKEKREMDKQLEKAKAILKTPSKAEIIKRSKFLKGKKLGYELNQDLINKTTLLLGIKGYYSNCNNLTDQEIITHYQNLWNVEKAFRISKSDLKMRPIYHFKETTIKSHILICFMALAIAKYIEIKTKKSIKSVINLLEDATDTTIIDKTTGEKITFEPEISREMEEILRGMK